MTLTLCPITRDEAFAFIDAHHRHHRRPQGWMFGVAAARSGEIVGVAAVGRPVSRVLQDGYTAEVIRLCVLEGARNACSMLYAACWRACRAIGYRKLVTYTLAEEGASLRASGWWCVGVAGGGSWSRKDRPRVDTHPTQTKIRWEISA